MTDDESDALPPIAARPCMGFALNKLAERVNEMKIKLMLPVEHHEGDTCGTCGWTRGAHGRKKS